MKNCFLDRLVGSLIFCLIWVTIPVQAQFPLSAGAGGYSGLYGAFVNPAQLSYNWMPWGIHLPGAGFTLQNNGLRADRFSGLAALAGRSYSFDLDNAISRSNAIKPDVLIRNLQLEQTSFQSQFWLQGIGGYLHWGYHTFGLGIGNRSFNELSNVSANMFKHFTEGIRFDSLLDVPVTSNGLLLQASTFTEIQLAWSWRFLNKVNRSASIGVVLKPIIGYQGFHGQFDELTYTVTNTDTFRLNRFAGNYANSGASPYFSGLRGVGVDLGFVYVSVNPDGPDELRRQRTRISCTPFGKKFNRNIKPIPNHLWRAGVSLLDFGSFRSNATRYIGTAVGLNTSVLDPAIVSGQGAEPFFLNLIDNGGRLVNDSSGYTVGLATAVGVQADFWIIDRFYLHASAVQRLPLFGDYQLTRLNQWMVAPRYESPWLEFGLPLSLYEYRHVQLGIWARLGPLTFGTDRLGELLGFRRLMGADAYVSVNLLPFWK